MYILLKMYKKCIKKYINILDKGKALCYIYIILIDRFAKNGHLAMMATTEIKRVLGRYRARARTSDAGDPTF